LFLQKPPLPENSNVLIEDDVLYVIITRRPDFFKNVLAVQAFNTCIQRLSATLGFKGFGRCFKI